jgi:hypothetical protein
MGKPSACHWQAKTFNLTYVRGYKTVVLGRQSATQKRVEHGKTIGMPEKKSKAPVAYARGSETKS